MNESTTELATVSRQDYLGLQFSEIKNVAQVLAASGIFEDAKDANVAFAKVLAGQEMGLTPFQSLREITFIKGKPNVSANVKAAKIKASGKYNYHIIAWDTTRCEIEFYENSKSVGKVNYTEADAKSSGVYERNQQYKLNPKAMYFAGAIRQGQRAYCPDTMGGIPTYDREELEIVEAEVMESPKPSQSASLITGALVPQQAPLNSDDNHQEAAEQAEKVYDDSIEMITPAQQRKMFAVLKSKGVETGEQQKGVVYGLAESMFGKPIISGKELTKIQAMELISNLEDQDADALRFFFGEKNND